MNNMQDTVGEARMNSKEMLSYGTLQMDVPVLADQQKTYLQQLCIDTRYSRENLSGPMDYMHEEREKVREIRVRSVTWWYIYIYISKSCFSISRVISTTVFILRARAHAHTHTHTHTHTHIYIYIYPLSSQLVHESLTKKHLIWKHRCVTELPQKISEQTFTEHFETVDVDKNLDLVNDNYYYCRIFPLTCRISCWCGITGCAPVSSGKQDDVPAEMLRMLRG